MLARDTKAAPPYSPVLLALVQFFFSFVFLSLFWVLTFALNHIGITRGGNPVDARGYLIWAVYAVGGISLFRLSTKRYPRSDTKANRIIAGSVVAGGLLFALLMPAINQLFPVFNNEP